METKKQEEIFLEKVVVFLKDALGIEPLPITGKLDLLGPL
jgi:hypothetical protein